KSQSRACFCRRLLNCAARNPSSSNSAPMVVSQNCTSVHSPVRASGLNCRQTRSHCWGAFGYRWHSKFSPMHRSMAPRQIDTRPSPRRAGEPSIMVAKTISTTGAPIADGVALNELLNEVSDAEDIRAELTKPCFVRRWQHSVGRSSWITSDGTTAACLTLSGLDLDETVALRVCFDVHWQREDFVLSAHILSEIVGKTTILMLRGLLAAWLGRTGLKTMLVFPSIEVARQYMSDLAFHGIKVGMLVGQNPTTRREHAARIAEAIAASGGQGGFAHTIDGADSFAANCALPAFATDDASLWRFGYALCEEVLQGSDKSGGLRKKLCPIWTSCGRNKAP